MSAQELVLVYFISTEELREAGSIASGTVPLGRLAWVI